LKEERKQFDFLGLRQLGWRFRMRKDHHFAHRLRSQYINILAIQKKTKKMMVKRSDTWQSTIGEFMQK
jgi:hypothetical protein